jgi:hypothetical protein
MLLRSTSCARARVCADAVGWKSVMAIRTRWSVLRMHSSTRKSCARFRTAGSTIAGGAQKSVNAAASGLFSLARSAYGGSAGWEDGWRDEVAELSASRGVLEGPERGMWLVMSGTSSGSDLSFKDSVYDLSPEDSVYDSSSEGSVPSS